MILKNLRVINSPEINWIEIKDNFIQNLGTKDDAIPTTKEDLLIEFENVIAFPGLINSHDHLEFNLFPKLGNKKYKDYIEWGEDIHQANKDVIDAVQKIPFELRYEYGIYKNLISGITTVVNHGRNIEYNNELINIHSYYTFLHSVELEKKWKLKLNNIFNRLPVLVHIGEGTNDKSHNEIDKLIKWNYAKKSLIGIHAIMMDEKQAESFKAIVWCPDSNYFLYGSTCAADKLKNKTTILFGSDSNVSADWNIWDQLRFARKLKLLDDYELYNSINSSPAETWNLKLSGFIKKGFKANIVIVKNQNKENDFDSFFNLNPEYILLIIKDGKIVLFDSILLDKIKPLNVETDNFTKINLNNQIKFVKGRLDNLCLSIKSYYPSAQFPFEIMAS